jgi:hypothetical protein
MALFFDLPAFAADQERWDRVETITKGHGRLETRLLKSTTGDCTYLGWPAATQVIRHQLVAGAERVEHSGVCRAWNRPQHQLLPIGVPHD